MVVFVVYRFQIGTGKEKKTMSTTVYDDVFRTMVQKMPRLFIALINEVFNTDYPDDVELQNNGAPYKVELPESCVIYLRHNDKTPDYLDVDVTFDGKILPYRTKVIKVQDYTKDELFKKKLMLLLPFYILRYEKYLNDSRQEAVVCE